MILLLLKSILMWMAVVASIGPIGLLCINRTLKHGFLAGLITGLGVSIADAVYGCVSGFGLTFISNFLISHQFIIRLIGGLFLCYLGLKIFFKAKVHGSIKESKKTYVGDFLSAFVLTLTNPMTIITFIAVFASIGVGSIYTGYMHAVIIVAGIFFGSLLWYLILSSLVSLAHKKINTEIMKWINRVSGVIIIVFGILAIVGFKK
jgi:threonine/homoserine/homoserine lactone efflux protein